MSNWQPGQGGGGGMYGGGGGKQGDEDDLYDYDYTYVLFMCAPPTPLLPCRQALAIPTHRSPATLVLSNCSSAHATPQPTLLVRRPRP